MLFQIPLDYICKWLGIIPVPSCRSLPLCGIFPEPPAGQLRLASSDVLEFISSLLKSVLPDLPSHYFSTGGDEVNTECYAQDTETQKTLKQNGWSFEQALSHFVANAHDAVRSLGKVPVVWEGELLLFL